MSDLQALTWMEPLAVREIQILRLISEGLSNREIAQQLFLTLETIKWYNKQIFRKLGVNSRTQAIKLASEQGLLEQETSAQGDENVLLGNLPARLTSFVGREKELAEIKQLLKSNRLVVITGPGGSGKTRLALEVGDELSKYYQDGAWLVELASLHDPNLVIEAIAQSLKVQLSVTASPIETLKRSLSPKHLLLLLDNFEHLLEASPLVGELLTAAPRLTILATSRERLNIYGEHEYPLRPLLLPDGQHSESLDKLLSYEAINLFVQRAHAAQPNLILNEEDLRAIERICVHLDGLPLAIELAASPVRVYSLPELAKQVEESLGALPRGPRDLPSRQRTLHTAIEWSENLLQPEERILFNRLAVFSAGATLEAIERVCNTGLTKRVPALLSTLVEKNLVFTREGQDGELRFMMLQTILDYAGEKLSSSEEIQGLRRLHAAYFTELTIEVFREYRIGGHAYWYAKLHAEHDNLRSALAWSLGDGDIDYALNLIGNSPGLWLFAGYGREIHRWCELILENGQDVPPDQLASVLLTGGHLAYKMDDLQKAEKQLRRSIKLYQESSNESGMAWAMTFLATCGVGLMSKIDDYLELACQGLELFQKLGEQPGISGAHNALGELNRAVGDYDAAQLHYEEGMQIAQRNGERTSEAVEYMNLGFIAYHRNQYQSSAELIRQGLLICQELGTNYGLAQDLAALAGPIGELGDPVKAARLLGAADAEMESLGIGQQPADQIEIDRFQSSIRQALGEEAFQEAWQAGRELSIQEAVKYALST